MPVVPTKTTHKTPYPTISPRHHKLSQAGRTILVTGGATGIGLAISRAFIAASASRLIIIGRRGNVIDATIDKLAEEIKELGDDATMLFGRSCDVTDPKSSESFWDNLAADGIVVDTMVLNAASPGGPGPILERGTSKVWEDFTANVRSTVYFTERFYGQGGHGVSNKKVGRRTTL
jgi:NAD(P)-dependent dehydrogenase (short-subunit alcohol dehydrogenase family)